MIVPSALQELLDDVRGGRIDIIVVYKVDRLTRSLADFAKLVELFDQRSVSFVSVTQSFNTTTSMGRLTLNVLLSFAQFEREVIGERVRDKISASKRHAGRGSQFRRFELAFNIITTQVIIATQVRAFAARPNPGGRATSDTGRHRQDTDYRPQSVHH
jgi:DNA invertase Pin-like site-specific DNA recombinase